MRTRWRRHNCRQDGHIWWYRIVFDGDELRNFAICTRCGAMDGEYFSGRPGTVELLHGWRND